MALYIEIKNKIIQDDQTNLPRNIDTEKSSRQLKENLSICENVFNPILYGPLSQIQVIGRGT